MSAANTLLPPTAAYTSEPIYRLTVEQYHDLIDRGKLTSDDPVELIEGVLVFKMPKNPPHAIATGLVSDAIQLILPTGWHIRIQEPVTLDDGEPEPDVAIVRGNRRDYFDQHPGPSDLALGIEVADSTLARDRGIKLRSYARAGVGCYWIVNLIDRQIEVYTDPDSAAQEPRYRIAEVFKVGDSVPVMIDGLAVGRVAVGDVILAD